MFDGDGIRRRKKVEEQRNVLKVCETSDYTQLPYKQNISLKSNFKIDNFHQSLMTFLDLMSRVSVRQEGKKGRWKRNAHKRTFFSLPFQIQTSSLALEFEIVEEVDFPKW